MVSETNKIICGRKIPDERNGGTRVCGGLEHTLSGSNGWATIRRATKDSPAIKVLKQRYVCKDCGGFNFRHLDGSEIRDSYTDDEIEQLVSLTRQKLFNKKLNRKIGGR